MVRELEKNGNWGGDKVGYHGIHSWLKNYYGKADRCENNNCPIKCLKYEWALLKSCKYERRRANFIRLCVSCHKKYDLPKVRKKSITRHYFKKGLVPWNKGIKYDEKMKSRLNMNGLINYKP